MKKLLGYQLADRTGKNIQGDYNDPTNQSSFDIMSPERAFQIIQTLGCDDKSRTKYLLMPIFEGCIEEPSYDGRPLKMEIDPDEEGDDLIAVAPDGTRIRGTLERAYGTADIIGEWKRLPDGSLDFAHSGYTDGLHDNQETVERNGKTVFADEEGREWTEDQIRLIRNPEDSE